LDFTRHLLARSLPEKTIKILPLLTGLMLLLSPSIPADPLSGEPEPVWIIGTVVDEYGVPVQGIDVTVRSDSGSIYSIQTNAAGIFELELETAAEYRLSLNKIGFFRLENQKVVLHEGTNEFSFTVSHEFEIHEETDVYSSSESIKPNETSHSHTLIAREIRDIPVKSTYDLRNSLQVMPEIVRDNKGELHVAGGRTQETQYLLDGFDIGDPVTGDLSVRVNVDSVEYIEVESGRFSTRYGNGGAGVMTIDTLAGDDRWRAGATDFLPGISLHNGLHLTSWYPRFTLSGPIKKGRAWFSDALSLQRTKSFVEDLPENEDSTSQWAGDNMLRTQAKVTPNYSIQGNFLYNQIRASNLGLNPYSPISTTRNLKAYRSFFSLKQQIWTNRAFYELGLAGDFNHDDILPRGFLPYIVTPDGSAGNHYETLSQKNRRWQGFGSATFPNRQWRGSHDLQVGFSASTVSWTHNAVRNEIQVRRADDTLAQQTLFFGTPEFRIGNTMIGFYLHDTWRVAKSLVLQMGIREDWNRLMQKHLISPRLAANILPFDGDRTKFTFAWGVFQQPLTLDLLGPAHDQHRSDIFYDPAGIPVEPYPVSSSFLLPDTYLNQSRFYTTSAGWEQKLSSSSRFRINFTQRLGRMGFAYDKLESDPSENLFVLQNNRRDRYRSFQISFQHLFSDKASVTANYTFSSTMTNRVFDYALDTLVFSPQESGPPVWDAPHRLVSSGWAPSPFWGLLFSYHFEYRTGFPFTIVDERQQVVGPANRIRYPDYASLNAGAEKRFKFLTREWAVRFTIINLISRENPDAVVNNIDSPNFLKFAGGQKRSLKLRIRLVG